MPTLKPCLDCGQLTSGTRCPDHTRQVDRAKTATARARRPYTNQEKLRRARAVTDWRAQHGDVCPGYGVSAHPSSDLAADHVHPVGAGGSEEGPLSVLCRSCNGRKAAGR